ncbi:hypothetical protein Salmuc_02146 [Salipiger mucosus DSM 16094]|uniref:CusB-like beta-barrel domain-containing protein n=1 Tax=Salipiger mucosus DSM 16094 TaxID=1123237 RepID=S9QVB3_9RHOB|nr:hypothetical protein Salmuc_02146 [Salipiger mucosus DSM 16094]
MAHVAVRKGADLAAGQEIARLVDRDLEAALQQASEELNRAQREFDNARSLFDRGVATADRVSDARAGLASAEAQVARAEENLDNAVIRAPFAGRLDALDLDEGEFVQAGTEIGTVLDTDPLEIAIQVPQQSVARISEGQAAQVAFITGEQRTGEVVFVGADADPETRTFKTEIRVPNPENDLASGLSAQVRIPTGTLQAHFVSPAVLSLGTDGTLGVKTVTPDDEVVFHPVSVERTQVDGVWVSGLPENADIITIGQGFVRDGEIVDPSPEKSESEQGTGGQQ